MTIYNYRYGYCNWCHSTHNLNSGCKDAPELNLLIESSFEIKKIAHLKHLESIRSFILGDKNNQPQVTYVPKMMEFEKLYAEMKKWIEESYDEDEND